MKRNPKVSEALEILRRKSEEGNVIITDSSGLNVITQDSGMSDTPGYERAFSYKADFLREVRTNEEVSVPEIGSLLKATEMFKPGDIVDVTGISKGKGFQGVVKRHNFGGVGDATHGQHNRLRAPGSVGACSTPARVFKGMKMAGRMGSDRVTMQNLQVVKVYTEKNLIVVKGSIPGAKGSFVLIEK